MMKTSKLHKNISLHMNESGKWENMYKINLKNLNIYLNLFKINNKQTINTN